MTINPITLQVFWQNTLTTQGYKYFYVTSVPGANPSLLAPLLFLSLFLPISSSFLRHPPSFSLPLSPPSSSLLRIPSSNIHSSLVFTHNENTIAKDRNQTSSNDQAVLRLFIPAQVSAIQRRVCELMNSIYCPLSPLQPPHCTISFISHVWLWYNYYEVV